MIMGNGGRDFPRHVPLLDYDNTFLILFYTILLFTNIIYNSYHQLFRLVSSLFLVTKLDKPMN